MEEMYTKTSVLLGNESIEKLKNSCVAVVGLGGVGSFAAEALARSGVGRLIIIDCDTVDPSNINRQLYALSSTVGSYKAAVAKERIDLINPACEVIAHISRATANNLESLIGEKCDYIIDAIDSVEDKMALILYAEANAIPIISSMGTANKLYPEKLSVTDIYKTGVCPLAKVIRKKCRDYGISSLKTICSQESPQVRPPSPAACVFVPGAAGLIAAREAVLELIG